jgi:hypothetical protein
MAAKTQPVQTPAIPVKSEIPTLPCKIAKYKYSPHVQKGQKVPMEEYERIKATGIDVGPLFE